MKTQVFAGISALMLTGALIPFTQIVRASESLPQIEPQAQVQVEPQAQTQGKSQEQPQRVAQAASTVLASGQFVNADQDHPTTGTARIVEENGQRYVELDSDFDTARGPAVEITLHRSDRAPNAFAEGDYITLGTLQSFSGAQRYAIPANVDLADYGSVAIWCEQFNITFGSADV